MTQPALMPGDADCPHPRWLLGAPTQPDGIAPAICAACGAAREFPGFHRPDLRASRHGARRNAPEDAR